MLAPHVWRDLAFIAGPVCHKCGYPFDFEIEKGAVCADCLEDPPPFTTARAALAYTDISRELVLAFKHADKTHLVRAFTPWLMSAGSEMWKQADCLIPVPLHRWRLLRRRYNQSALLAHDLGKAMNMDVLPDGLQRIRPTASQGHLSAEERRRNVRRAFSVNTSHIGSIRDRACILIDDVYTSGATIKECANALLKAGAASVNVLTVVRVVKGI